MKALKYRTFCCQLEQRWMYVFNHSHIFFTKLLVFSNQIVLWNMSCMTSSFGYSFLSHTHKKRVHSDWVVFSWKVWWLAWFGHHSKIALSVFWEQCVFCLAGIIAAFVALLILRKCRWQQKRAFKKPFLEKNNPTIQFRITIADIPTPSLY